MNKGGVRGGTRGGKDQFDWEDVRVDKDRENYLGHSLKASVGRWQKGKDLTWYTKESKVSSKTDKLKVELAALKQAEDEAMAAALGLKPPAPVKPQQALSKQELAEVCRRKSSEDTEGMEERIKGLGYQSRRAQAMFVGTKSTTTKEGATIFEHDSGLKDDGKLKMSARSSRPSESDVVAPEPEEYGPLVMDTADDATTQHHHAGNNSPRGSSNKRDRRRENSDSDRTAERSEWKTKKVKKKKKRRARETDSEEDWRREPKEKHKKQRLSSPSRKRKRYSSSSDSERGSWAEVSTKQDHSSHHHHKHHHKHKKTHRKIRNK